MTRRSAPFAMLFLVAVMAIVVAACGGSTTTSAVRKVGAADAVAMLGSRTVIDVRTPEEFAAGHIAGAQNIDFYASDFADRIGALDQGTSYVVYCHTGNRSGQATALMADAGFTSVTDVDGGIEAWTAAGLPTVTGD